MTEPKSIAERKADVDQEFDALVCEVSKQLESGQSVDLDALADEHPQHIGRLRKLLPTLEAMADLGHSIAHANRGVASVAGDHASTKGVLGDFRIIREVGRGGMGVVYEAEQLSLQRRVALKILPFAAVLDQRQLQRFKNESLAAAQLDHPNIVDVFGVGCERGVHFYAMRYIDGPTFAEVIGELRQLEQHSEVAGKESEVADQRSEVAGAGREGETPAEPGSPHLQPTVVFEKEPSRKTESEPERPTSQIETGLIAALSTERSANSPAYFRSLARLGVQVAEALDHAHQQGIVHRDIKPPNLMLDARGKAWVTDFGLAHIETNASLTMTGDLLGTVRYMSPEQALAKRIVVDHRTDIYSLGVTLYELLTLQPVFAGKDRQELLRQIAFEEPRPLRRLNKSIPAELETIVLKAMAKNPAERYATAQELADDLQRFQEDKPIRARRPTVFQRVRKWSRRHKPVVVSGVVSAMVLLVVGVAGLALSNVRVRHEQLRTNRALEKAENNYQEAQAQRRRAEENVQLALQALDEIYLKIAEQKLPDQLELNEQDQKFLEQVLPFYEKIAKQKADDPHTQLARAKAYLRVGNIYSRLRHRQTEKAEAAVRQAIAMFGELDAEFPTELEHAHYLAISQRDLGILLWETGRAKEMEATFRQAIEIYEKIAFKLPSHQSHELLNVYTRLGILLNEKLAQPNEAEQIYRQSLVLAEKLVARFPNAPALRSRVIPAQSGLARALRRTGRLQQAEQLYRQVIDSCEKSLSDSPKHSTYRFYFGSSLLELGRILRKTNRRQQAEQAYRRAKDSFEKRLADAPNERGTRFYLGLCFRSLGALLKDTNRRQEAEQAYKRALALHEEVLQQGSDQLWHRGVLTDTLYEFGSLLLATGRLTEAESHYRRSLELREQLIREFPYSSRRSEKVGNARTALAGLLIQMGRKEEAERMEIDIPPPHTMEEYVQRGRFYDQIREYEKAQADFVKAAELGSDNPMINNNAAWFSIRFPSGNPESVERAVRWANKVVELAPQKGYAWSTLGVAHYRAGDWKVAIEALEKSEEIDKGKNFSFNGFFLALAHWQLGHHDEAHKWYRKAVEWMKKNRPDDEELIGFRAEAQELFGLNIPAIAPKPEAKQKETADER